MMRLGVTRRVPPILLPAATQLHTPRSVFDLSNSYAGKYTNLDRGRNDPYLSQCTQDNERNGDAVARALHQVGCEYTFT